MHTRRLDGFIMPVSRLVNRYSPVTIRTFVGMLATCIVLQGCVANGIVRHEIVQQGGLPAHKENFKDCAECPLMVHIPTGSFLMGSQPGEASDNATPQHKVTISAFSIGKTEITRSQYAAFVQATGYNPNNGCMNMQSRPVVGLNWRNPPFPQDDNHPVVCLDIYDINKYISWLSNKTGRHYRLPSEAEWEYAARAGDSSSAPWGDNVEDACQYGNLDNSDGAFKCKDGYTFTAPVGSFKENPFGLHDMIGNAMELVEDCWHKSYDGAPTDGSAWTSFFSCKFGVVRGLFFYSYKNPSAYSYRSSYAGLPMVSPKPTLGFRVAISGD